MCQISCLSSASSRTWPTGACEERIVRQTNGATRNPRIHLNQAQTENDRLRNSTTNDHRRSLCTISVAFHSRSTRLDRPPTVYDSTRPSMTKHVAPLLPRSPFARSTSTLIVMYARVHIRFQELSCNSIALVFLLLLDMFQGKSCWKWLLK